MERYTFQKSRLEVVVDLARGVYGLGPQGSFGIADGELEWPEMGRLPTEAFAGYSACPEESPGWILALGGVAEGTRLLSVEGALGATRADPEPDPSAWHSLDHCLLGGRLWAAEMRVEEPWLRLVTTAETRTWYLPHRPKTSAREEPGEL